MHRKWKTINFKSFVDVTLNPALGSDVTNIAAVAVVTS